MIYTFDAGAAPEYEIEYYATENGECPVQEMLDAMPPKHAAKAAKFFALLEQKGPHLPRPYADALKGKIRELVIHIHHHGYRFPHFFAGKTIVVTHGFLKKTWKPPPEEIARAEKHMSDYQA